MENLTTGQVARAAGLSEKAVRIYVEKELLLASRDERTGARRFRSDQAERARLIGLLRSLDLSLPEIAKILDASDVVDAFDHIWSDKRRAVGHAMKAAEYIRSVMARQTPDLPPVAMREVPQRLVLTASGRAVLSELPRTIGCLTESLFKSLTEQNMPLTDHVYVEFRERATATSAAFVEVCIPIESPVWPGSGCAITVDEAHTEAFIPLLQEQASQGSLLLPAHDHLSTGSFSATFVPSGNNREIYFPNFGTGVLAEPVMEVAVPVSRTP